MNKCPLCNHSTRSIHQKSFDIHFHYCSHCEFLYKDSSDRISSEEEKEIYDRHENSYEDERYIAYFERFLNASLLPYISNDACGLDYGSGPSPVLSTLLNKRYNHQMDIYDLYYHDIALDGNKRYDFITCTEVIEHIENPIETLSYFKSILKEDGILSMMTQFHRKDDDFFMNWHYMRDMSHISFFTEKTMQHIAEEVGLELIQCDGKRYMTFRNSNQHPE